MNGTEEKHRSQLPKQVMRVTIRLLLILVAGIAIWCLAAHWVPSKIAVLLNDDYGDWVRLGLGGLAGATLLTLLQSGAQLPNRTLDLIRSLPQQPWGEFRRRFADLAECVLVPGVCLLFAIGLGEQVSRSARAEAAQIALEQARKAMRLQGYTAPPR